MATLGTLEYLISINSSQLNSGLSSSEKKVKGFGNKLSSWAVAKGQVLGKMIEKAGQATMQFVKGSVQESMSFDKSMAQVAATLGKSTGEVQDLAKFAREMGSKTAFTAQEAAQGLNYMALAGYDAQTSMKMLPTVLDLAAAGNMDLAAASDMVTDAQSALGLSIEQTETMVDQMAKTSSKTNTSVEQLGQAFLTVGGSAKKLKGGTQELSALLGVLANNGIKGSEGGTALRNVLNGLSNPAGKAAKQLKRLGVEAYDADGNLRSMPDILTEMNDALSDKTMKERTEIFAKMFNVRDLKSIEALLSMTGDDWKSLMDEIGDSKGAAAKMAETQLDNLAGDVTKFKSALGEAKLTIVEGLTPSFRNLTKAGTAAIDRITKAFKRGGMKEAFKELKNIIGDVKDAFKKWVSIKLSDYLKPGDDATWLDIAAAAVKKLKDNIAKKISETKIKLANYFELGEDATWGNIASGVKTKLLGKIKEKKIRIAQLLHIPNAGDASWSDIAGNIINRLKPHIGKGGSFIKALILGDSYSEDSTWGDVATELTKKVEAAFADGGILNILLGNAADKAAALATFAGDLISGIADWISKNADKVGEIIGNIADAFGKAAPKVIAALAKVLGDPNLWKSIGSALGAIGETLVDLIFGKGATKKILSFFGIGNDVRSEAQNLTRNEADKLKQLYKVMDANKNDTMMTKDIHGNMSPLNEATALSFFENLKSTMGEAGFNAEQIASAIESIKGMGAEDALAFIEKLTEFTSVPQDITLEPDASAVDQAVAKMNYSAPVVLVPTTGESTGKVKTPGKNPFGKFSLNGDYDAKGNWNVPYDNYPALLHRGEMVLNKSQARQLRDGEYGGGFSMGEAVSEAVDRAMSKVYVMLNGDKVGDLTTRRIKRNINASSYNKLRAMGG